MLLKCETDLPSGSNELFWKLSTSLVCVHARQIPLCQA